MKKQFVLSTMAVTIALGVTQAFGASVLFNFADNTSDGWSTAKFGSGIPAAPVVTIGANNYINLALNGNYQEGEAVTGSPGLLAGFDAAMFAALNNPASSYIQYDYYIDTSTFTTPGTYLQLGSYVNCGSGFYGQTGTPSAYEPQFDGTQVASGSIFYGTVNIPFSAYGADANAATENFFRFGMEINGDGTGVTVQYTNIKIVGVPEPATLAMCGLGLLGGLLALRRRNS